MGTGSITYSNNAYQQSIREVQDKMRYFEQQSNNYSHDLTQALNKMSDLAKDTGNISTAPAVTNIPPIAPFTPPTPPTDLGASIPPPSAGVEPVAPITPASPVMMPPIGSMPPAPTMPNAGVSFSPSAFTPVAVPNPLAPPHAGGEIAPIPFEYVPPEKVTTPLPSEIAPLGLVS